jgi:hypothetical protein
MSFSRRHVLGVRLLFTQVASLRGFVREVWDCPLRVQDLVSRRRAVRWIILSWGEMANTDDTDLYIIFVVLCSGIACHSFFALRDLYSLLARLAKRLRIWLAFFLWGEGSGFAFGCFPPFCHV